MGAIENLQAADAALAAAVDAAVAKLGEPSGVPEEAVQAEADSVNASVGKLNEALNPTPPPSE